MFNFPTLIQSFDFDSQAVRVVVREEQPWFVAADVCRVLDIANSRDAVGALDADEIFILSRSNVGNADISLPNRGMQAVNESGLYALIFKSRKPEAKRFRKWVTSEVLPAIRKDGEYRATQAAANTERGQLARLRRLLLETAEGVKSGQLTPGKAQAIALTGQRYLETLKIEAEAIGYENVLGLRGTETTGRLLPRQDGRGDATAELLQDLPQPGLPRAEADEPELPSEATASEESLGQEEPGPLQSAREGLQAPEVDPRNGTGADA